MLLRGPSEKLFDQSICRTKEQKTRLQNLTSAILKSVMRSADKNGSFLEEKSARIMAVSVKTS